MKLYTIRSLKAWRSDQKEGFIWNSIDPTNVIFWNPYHWMAKQMRERLKVPTRRMITFPVWAWLKKPNLRCERHNYRGAHVLIEFEMDEILLSDFDAWHCVLNQWYMGTQKETNQFERDRKKDGLELRAFEQLPWNFRIRMEKSWEKVFIIKKKSVAQATMWEIPIENIKKVIPFKGLLPKNKSF